MTNTDRKYFVKLQGELSKAVARSAGIRVAIEDADAVSLGNAVKFVDLTEKQKGQARKRFGTARPGDGCFYGLAAGRVVSRGRVFKSGSRRIDTSMSMAIIVPRKAMSAIEGKYQGRSSKRGGPWNLLRINADIAAALDLVPGLYSGTGHNSKVLVVIPNADGVPADQWPKLIKAIRVKRHYGVSYALGFRSKWSIPGEVAALADVNLFKD